ncbi:MAG: hypothetical protein KG003_10030, partial [Bacteroidetes bacterium]|nr:hypothetical protein [Bacteroidota bacterium]
PDGTCEIEHYCFVMNFGYSENGVQVKTFSDLWDELCVKYCIPNDWSSRSLRPNDFNSEVESKHFVERGLLTSSGDIPEKYKQNSPTPSSED